MIIIDKDSPPILVYQMGKVGSASVKHTLIQSKLKNPIFHIHQLTYEGIDWSINDSTQRLEKNRKDKNLNEDTKMYTEFYLQYILRQLQNHRTLREKIDINID